MPCVIVIGRQGRRNREEVRKGKVERKWRGQEGQSGRNGSDEGRGMVGETAGGMRAIAVAERKQSGWEQHQARIIGAKKRPSVETEGRLTIACHMTKLEESFYLLVHPAALMSFPLSSHCAGHVNIQ